MSVTIKTNTMKYRDPEDGQYKGVDVIVDKATSERIADINAAGAAQVTAVNNASDAAQSILPTGTTLADLGHNSAAEYVAGNTYAVGDYAVHDYMMYKCNTAHSDASWTAAHWTRVNAGDEITSVNNNLNALKQDVYVQFLGYESGFMTQEGSIVLPVQFPNKIYRYSVPSRCSEIALSGRVVANTSYNYAALWFVKDGSMIPGGYVPVTEHPQTWSNYKINVPQGTEEVWAYHSLEIAILLSESLVTTVDNVETDLNSIHVSLTDTLISYDQGDGYLVNDGTIYRYGSDTGMIYKYTVPENQTKIYVTGRSSLNPSANLCILWFVQNNQMMSGEYISVETKPQTWSMFEVSVPTGAQEIWAFKNITIYSSDEYDAHIAKRICTLESEISGIEESITFQNWHGSYTAAKRVQGLRILADAQSCYFIPFNALGLGRSRDNGTYGDNYIQDQIHPTTLGGYNVAVGVWSYLRNIPLWYTSVPSDTTPVLDGAQWSGKKWYAYGTSLTLESSGKWTDHVANFSGMTCYNKGIGGGAIVSNRSIYNALRDMSDGKLEADLITIEVGANDHGILGYPWSTDVNEFYGALNSCIKYMFANGIQAQVVIMASYYGRYNVTTHEPYDVDYVTNPK